MRFQVPKIDVRTAWGRDWSEPVLDLDTGKPIGVLRTSQAAPRLGDPTANREITLFKKYGGSFDSHEECVAFAKGVEVVLNHMLSTGDERRPSTVPKVLIPKPKPQPKSEG
jgi:hypothetical protein